MAAAAAPPARLSLCSQTLLELAGRLILVAEEDPAQQRRHQSAQVRSGGALAVAVLCTGGARVRAAGAPVACEDVFSAQGCLYRFTHPTDPTEAREGIAVR